MKLLHVALAASLLTAAPGEAAVITDGTMAPSASSTALQGPHYVIPETLGRRQGNNLFHSFSKFDISESESARFTGNTSIQNIISRVTDGQPSYILGKIISADTRANLYLVNPNGIMFGPKAALDVNGSFYATTADYLEIGPVRFDAEATVPANFHLATVPPSAFGFLGPNPAPIAVTGSRLSVPETITLVGGDITLKRYDAKPGAILAAPRGLNLVAVGSAGKAVVADGGIDTSTFTKMGSATVLGTLSNPGIDDIATTTGSIFISAGAFLVDRAFIASRATGSSDGGNVSIAASEVQVINGGKIRADSHAGRAGDIRITATRSITLSDSLSGIETGKSGNVTLEAPLVTLENDGVIMLNREGSGKGGDLKITSGELNVSGLGSAISNTGGSITIDTHALTMSEEGSITASNTSKSEEDGGNVLIKVQDAMHLSGESMIGTAGTDAGGVTIDARDATVTLDHAYIYVGNWGGQYSAPINVSAKNVTIKNQGRISSISGETIAGDITITATGQLTVSNGIIRSNSRGSKDAGNIVVSASNILVEEGGIIHTLEGDPDRVSEVTGNGGSISIHAAESVTISGAESQIDVSTLSKGDAGTLTITSPLLHLANGGRISSASLFTGAGAGNAGMIDLRIGKVLSLDSASITTDADHAHGGDIRIDPVLVYLKNGAITTSVHGGEGNGGNILMVADGVVLEGSRIAADADLGHGGSVGITAALFIADGVSAVTASSERGVPGTVDISAPLVDVSGNLVMLPERMLDDDDLVPRTCAVSDDSSSFLVGDALLQNRPDRNLLAY